MPWLDELTNKDAHDWYWWRSRPGKMAVPVYVGSGLLVQFFPHRDPVHANNIGGQWRKLAENFITVEGPAQ